MKPRGGIRCIVPPRNGDLDTAGALGVQPGTLGNAGSALVSTVRPTPAQCKLRHSWSRRPVPSADDHRRPLPSVCGHQVQICDLSHTACRSADSGTLAMADRGTRSLGNPYCQTSPHAGMHEQAQAPIEPESQEHTAGTTVSASGTVRPSAAGFASVPLRSAGADQARPGCAARGRGGARGAARSRRRPRHRMARDRRPARRDPAGGSPALSAPPP